MNYMHWNSKLTISMAVKLSDRYLQNLFTMKLERLKYVTFYSAICAISYKTIFTSCNTIYFNCNNIFAGYSITYIGCNIISASCNAISTDGNIFIQVVPLLLKVVMVFTQVNIICTCRNTNSSGCCTFFASCHI